MSYDELRKRWNWMPMWKKVPKGKDRPTPHFTNLPAVEYLKQKR